MEGRTDRLPGSDDGEDAVKLDEQASAGPDADRNDENVASADRADGEPVSAGPDESAQADISAPAETAGADTVREPDDDTVREAEADDSAGETGADDSAGHTDEDDTVRETGAATRADAPMRPGDVDETLIAFWDEKAVQRFRTEWHEVKADFVDDPIAALTRAHDLITEAVDDLTEALLAERDELDPLRDTSTPDTESMRIAMRGYREFMDRILAL
jgi:hypothetical protein